jgi:hypothetical protein
MPIYTTSPGKPLIRSTSLVGVILLLWVGYTALRTLFVKGFMAELWSAVLGFLPGISGVVLLAAAGLPRERLSLQVKPLSWRGLAVLVVIFALSLTVILHSTLFGLWHIGPLFLGAPRWAVLAVLIVPFLAGIGWGWQVRNDRTVLRAMVQHTLIWVVAGQFSMPQRDDRGATGMGVIIRDRGDDPSNFQTGG